MTRYPDPKRMPPAARLDELARILAAGIRRLHATPKKALAARAQPEPSCDPAVDAAETVDPEPDSLEVA